MHTRAATSQTLHKHQLAHVKQNLSEANRILVLVISFALLPVACMKRTVERRTLSPTPPASTVHVRRININCASAEELEALPGIGRVLAEQIVKHRSQHGPFRRVEHVMLVRGISERKFLEIAPLVTVN